MNSHNLDRLRKAIIKKFKDVAVYFNIALNLVKNIFKPYKKK